MKRETYWQWDPIASSGNDHLSSVRELILVLWRRSFLHEGYAVIFLHRVGSKRPFLQRFAGLHLLEDIVTAGPAGGPPVAVRPEVMDDMAEAHSKYRAAIDGGKLLEVPFETVVDYLHLLRAAARSVAPMKGRATVYLAAAVSDYYMAADAMAIHKIQSSSGALELSLTPVPKAVYSLVTDWCPSAFVVTFKLETDPEILEKKATDALAKYKHQLVVANILHTRFEVVYLFSPGGDGAAEVRGDPIDAQIVHAVTERHRSFSPDPSID
jgi:phosphopantothenate-cysteine ligase